MNSLKIQSDYADAFFAANQALHEADMAHDDALEDYESERHDLSWDERHERVVELNDMLEECDELAVAEQTAFDAWEHAPSEAGFSEDAAMPRWQYTWGLDGGRHDYDDDDALDDERDELLEEARQEEREMKAAFLADVELHDGHA